MKKSVGCVWLSLAVALFLLFSMVGPGIPFYADDEVEDAVVELVFYKELTGRELVAGEFAFRLSSNPSGLLGQVLEEVAVEDDGTISFTLEYAYDPDLYEEGVPVVYEYRIEEIVPASWPVDGVSFDDTVFYRQVTVTYENGVLSAEAQVAEDDATFRNKYEATDVWNPIVHKKLEGRDMEEEEFTFQLWLWDEVNKKWTWLQDTFNDHPGSSSAVSFPPVEYTQEDIGKKYLYKITEKQENLPWILYDDKEVTAEVTVFDQGNGTLLPSCGFLQQDQTFRNVYLGGLSGSWTPPEFTKILWGRPLKAGEFQFQLKEGDAVLQTKTNDAEGRIVFDPLPFTEKNVGETHTYTVSEVKGKAGGMVYDDYMESLTLTVNLNEENELTFYWWQIELPDHELHTFQNTYSASGSTTLVIAKSVNDKFFDDRDGEFSFALYDEEGKLLQTKKNHGYTVMFDPLYYTQDDVGKTFTYKIYELAGSAPGMTYDPLPVTFWIDVFDNGDGTLWCQQVRSFKTEKADFANQYKPVIEPIEPKEPIEPINWYPPLIYIKRLKALEGRLGDHIFRLLDAQGQVLASVRSDAEGKVAFPPLPFSTEDIGQSFSYTIEAVAGALTDFIYDTHTVRLKVQVKDDGEGGPELVVSSEGSTEFEHKLRGDTLPATGEKPVWPWSGLVLLGLSALLFILIRRRRAA